MLVCCDWNCAAAVMMKMMMNNSNSAFEPAGVLSDQTFSFFFILTISLFLSICLLCLL